MPDNVINITIKLNSSDASKIIEEISNKVNNLGNNINIANNSILTFDNLATKVGFRLQGFQNIIIGVFASALLIANHCCPK